MNRDYMTSLIDPILHVVSATFDVSVQEILSQERRSWVVKARHTVVYLICQRHPQLSHGAIERWWSARKGFVRYALDTITPWLEDNASLSEMMKRMRFALDAWDKVHACELPDHMPSMPEAPDWPEVHEQVALIVSRVAEHYGVPVEKIKSSSTQRDHYAARRVALYLITLLLPYVTGKDIGKLVGLPMRSNRIAEAIEHVTSHIEVDSSMRIAIERLKRNLEQELIHPAGAPRGAVFPTPRNVS